MCVVHAPFQHTALTLSCNVDLLLTEPIVQSISVGSFRRYVHPFQLTRMVVGMVWFYLGRGLLPIGVRDLSTTQRCIDLLNP